MGTERYVLDPTRPRCQGAANTIVQLIRSITSGVMLGSRPIRWDEATLRKSYTGEQIKKVRPHPWIAKDVPVHGFIFDVDTGRLSEVKLLENERAA